MLQIIPQMFRCLRTNRNQTLLVVLSKYLYKAHIQKKVGNPQSNQF
jgi:hypothetical protein